MGSVSINSKSLLSIDVGSSFSVGGGTISNGGVVHPCRGVPTNNMYSPVSAGTWSGTGAYQAVGGNADVTIHQFTASVVVLGTSGTAVPIDLASVQRVLISGTTGKAVVKLLGKDGLNAAPQSQRHARMGKPGVRIFARRLAGQQSNDPGPCNFWPQRVHAGRSGLPVVRRWLWLHFKWAGGVALRWNELDAVCRQRSDL